jgi:hypothetical protein
MYATVDYRASLPASAYGTKVLMDESYEPPYILAIGRTLPPLPDWTFASEAADAGIYLFSSSIFTSIRKVVGESGDCDLCEAIDRETKCLSFRAINVAPWEWININDAESVALAEQSPRLCP